ncbi:phosphatase PAP2 family protein [Streptomyces sp. NRRL F-5727]|uniref:phosphatase PAP2 family protein n=1 Tax=Streptomyces sp. NRRL F-5727 TaxID=1463871 RepID=UPI00099C76E2|nr:phosphatase PAP2 family protein [Streptomyces sp. NRRL F-5727]
MATRIRGGLGLRPGSREEGGRPPLLRELLLVTGLFLAYKAGRLAANGHEARAFHNADRVWDAERALHLPGEGAVQHLLLHGEPLIRVANTYYAAVHFPATIAFLCWLYWRRPAHYLWARRVLALVTGAALALHVLLPLAPPRMLAAAGLVDTARVYGPSVYGAAPEADSMANQFAAMPSLHFGWALMVAVGLIAATRTPLRWWWLLHPALTLLVIVGTANHYWLDAAVAAALLGLALLAVPKPARPARPAPPAEAPPAEVPSTDAPAEPAEPVTVPRARSAAGVVPTGVPR